MQQTTFGMGCFWCTEAVFQQLKGVSSVTPGYAGLTGHEPPSPTYEAVASGTSGYVEVAQISFDPTIVSYEQLLEVFWAVHDPTSINKQGADVGSQYRSVIFYNDEAQRKAGERSKQAHRGQFKQPIVTQLLPLLNFYQAEGYHQNYYKNNRSAPYCQVVIAPKLDKLSTNFKSLKN